MSALRVRRERRRLGPGTQGLARSAVAFGAVFLPLMLLGSGAASAVISPSSRTLSVGSFGKSFSESSAFGACGKARILAGPTLSSKTGVFRGSIVSRAPHCPGARSVNSASALQGLDLSTGLRIYPSGGHYLNVTWNFVINATWSLTPYTTCYLNITDASSYCLVDTWLFLGVSEQLTDLSNSTWGPYGAGYAYAFSVPGGTFGTWMTHYAYVWNTSAFNITNGTLGAGHFSGRFGAVDSFNLSGPGAIRASDRFELDLFLELAVSAEATSYDARTTGPASASASLNAGTSGNQVLLQSVTID